MIELKTQFGERNVFYEVEGATVGVILFHSYTGSPRDFTMLARLLQRKGIEVLCPTFEGHDTLDIEDLFRAHPDDWWIQAQEALAAMNSRQYEKLYLFGLSLGGIFATRLLTEHHDPHLAGGVFNSPVYNFTPIDVSPFFESYVKHLYEKTHRLDAFHADRTEIMIKHSEQVEEIMYFTLSFQMNLQDIVSRYFIAQSQKDEMIDPASAELLREALIHAEVDFHSFPFNTHVITVNRERQDFETALLNFIQA